MTGDGDPGAGALDWGTDDGLPGIGWLLLGGVLGIAAGVVCMAWVPLGIYPGAAEPTDGVAGWVAVALALLSLVFLALGVRGWSRASAAAKHFGHYIVPMGVATGGLLGALVALGLVLGR